MIICLSEIPVYNGFNHGIQVRFLDSATTVSPETWAASFAVFRQVFTSSWRSLPGTQNQETEWMRMLTVGLLRIAWAP